ncbi:hypothetical protein N7510_007749 [Penicillium lagena]|uniref:uncharacterized protein n=1 Tax=Penicillium lagena TaxID=94218 RepID=UPI002541570C|nr:uncharacterized protein N7510_007749 [Penicillium lagena]KAJ5611030.1 hypothetical protein N7510_007749 [Penicillium lagena]
MQSFYTPSTSTHISHGPAVDELRTKIPSNTKTSNSSHTLKIQRRGPFRRAIDRVRLGYYRYEVTFGLYVMTPSEKLVTNTFVIVILTLLLRLVWLLTGHTGEEMGAILDILGNYGIHITPASMAENAVAL